MNDFLQAAQRHHMWFGSYTRGGELKKVQVWCFLHEGRIEFLTHGDSLKARRAERNPRVVCFLGSENGPRMEGFAEIIRDRGEIARGYRAYWKTHRWMMLALNFTIRRNIDSGKQIMIRVIPDEPNQLAGLSDPEISV